MDRYRSQEALRRTQTSPRAYVDKGYRGHDAPQPRRVFISGQKRGVFGRIKRELTRRSAVEAVIGHMKAEGHLSRCYLKGRAGDAANVTLPLPMHSTSGAWKEYSFQPRWRRPPGPLNFSRLNTLAACPLSTLHRHPLTDADA